MVGNGRRSSGSPGDRSASVVWGCDPTCHTCHDPHEEGQARTSESAQALCSTRFVDATTNQRGGINKFLDGTYIRSTVGTGTIRPSAIRAVRRIDGLSRDQGGERHVDPYANLHTMISASGVSFATPPLLTVARSLEQERVGVFLWWKGAAILQRHPADQELNCSGCHMAEANESNTEGGTASNRGRDLQAMPRSIDFDFEEIPASGDDDGDGCWRRPSRRSDAGGPGSRGLGATGSVEGRTCHRDCLSAAVTVFIHGHGRDVQGLDDQHPFVAF